MIKHAKGYREIKKSRAYDRDGKDIVVWTLIVCLSAFTIGMIILSWPYLVEGFNITLAQLGLR